MRAVGHTRDHVSPEIKQEKIPPLNTGWKMRPSAAKLLEFVLLDYDVGQLNSLTDFEMLGQEVTELVPHTCKNEQLLPEHRKPGSRVLQRPRENIDDPRRKARKERACRTRSNASRIRQGTMLGIYKAANQSPMWLSFPNAPNVSDKSEWLGHAGMF